MGQNPASSRPNLFNINSLTIIVFLSLLFLFGIFGLPQRLTTVEAQSPQRLQRQDWNQELRIETICDTATGTLLYKAMNLYHGGDTGAMWGVLNGCAKNQHK